MFSTILFQLNAGGYNNTYRYKKENTKINTIL